jgi:hypothetical protein
MSASPEQIQALADAVSLWRMQEVCHTRIRWQLRGADNACSTFTVRARLLMIEVIVP